MFIQLQGAKVTNRIKKNRII